MKRIIVLFAFFCSYLGHSQVVTAPTLYAEEDAQTSSVAPSGNYGTIGTMGVSKTAATVLRSFLKFNLSTIPANAVITSAFLKLTPSGTENVTSTNSTQLYLDVCNTSWTEAGITHASNISNNTLFPTVTISNLVSSKREFQIRDFVQAIVEGRLPNQGWRIRRNDETTNVSTTYLTREDGTASNRPQLVIQYYLRSYVSAAAIVHTSSLSSTDGSISPTIISGSNTTMTCRWFNSSGTQIGTSQNLTGIGKGWYGLKYYGGADGDTTYQAFIVGTKCEDVSITFDPGPNYIDDARIHDLIQGTGTTVINFNHSNQSSYALLTAQRWTWTNWYNEKALLRFRLWVDPGCQVNTADMTLTGNAHSPLQRTNESEFDLNTSQWVESAVAYSNAPTYTATGKINLAAIPTGNNNLTTNIAAFFNNWKTNNLTNYGMVFQLQSYTGNVYTRMQFNSSEAVTASNRPSIAFKISWVNNTCDFTSYSRFKDVLDGSFVRTIQGKLKVQFNEDYDQKAGRFAKLILYDAVTNQIKAGINNDGTIIGAALLPAKVLEFDYNQHLLDLSTYSLVIGNDYVLELTTSKGEKSYIKFKYYN